MQTFVILILGLLAVGGTFAFFERRRGRTFLKHDLNRDRISPQMMAERERALHRTDGRSGYN
ncbi:hypothetical protein [Falsiphaeobacter marinintestinus]|uniref:hypothetical protein n=1 Tax=Falsiphaeobacter marinintestinus TaxID=1492905 RepID=UPI0011B6A91C|nr:hypothetical protein [Phaeobacter marinintestinus]